MQGQRATVGHEVRVYLAGDFHYSRAHPTADGALAEAADRKQELITAGWTEAPVMPD